MLMTVCPTSAASVAGRECYAPLIVTRITLAAFDNDGTLHPAKGVWSYLQKPLGYWEGAGRDILMSHLEGDLPYTAMVQATIARWAGRPEADFLAVLRTLPLRPGIMPFLRGLEQAGVRRVVLSSGIHWWEAIWQEQHGVRFDRYATNIVEVDPDGLCTGKVQMLVTDDDPSTNKGTWLRRWQAEWGIGRDATFAMGDGTGDIPLLKEARIAVCVDPTNDRVREAAPAGELRSGDFGDLQHLVPELGTMLAGLQERSSP
ncbi:MAG: hypothetical protein GEEBNDBF_00955 [bacterium]|nr:hypothetical protein [bacterium]